MVCLRENERDRERPDASAANENIPCRSNRGDPEPNINQKYSVFIVIHYLRRSLHY